MGDDKPFRVSRVSPSKHLHEEHPEQEEENKKKSNNIIAAAFTSVVKKILPKISENEGRARSGSNYGNTIYTEIVFLRSCFREITKDDNTKNPHFTQVFSEHWLQFLAAYEKLSVKEKHYPAIHKFINQMDGFPSRDEHAIGYYLSHYAGDEWLPFPYLEILRKLNRDYLVNSDNSDLARFIHVLSVILGDES